MEEVKPVTISQTLPGTIREVGAPSLPSAAFGRTQVMAMDRSLPRLVIKDRGQGLFDYEPEDFMFESYDPHPHISAPVAV